MDISVGDKATRSLTLTDEHVAGFADLSGDRNPLHFDEDFAAATPLAGLSYRADSPPVSCTRWWPWTCPAQEPSS